MTTDELMRLGPDAPLGVAEARALVRESLLAAAPSNVREHPVEAMGGAVTGKLLETASPSGQGVPQRGSAQRASRRDALADPRNRAVVVIGAFDGVHRGHRALVERARAEADARGDRLVVVTFSPDPAEVLAGPQRRSTLLPVAARTRALLGLGADAVVTLDFTRELAALPFDRFVREVLSELAELDLVVVGEDFRMGAGAAGDVTALAELGVEDEFEVIGMRLADDAGAPITATRIRTLVRAGRMEAAAGLLGRCHSVAGRVVHGRGEGTAFGFPTANVVLDDALCVPDQGVYAGYVVAGRAAWPAALNVGAPPSFSPAEDAPRSLVEANLLGFAGDLYGRAVEVVLVRWLRDSRPFDSLDELERTVLGNIEWVRATLGTRGVALGEGDA